MPKFGHNESGQRLYLSGVGAVYVLRSDEKKIIKVLQPPAGIWTDEQMRREVEGFLSRAKIQKAAARASQNWAPIQETSEIHEGAEGSSAGETTRAMPEDSPTLGAYLVMDRYERTVHSLIDGRVNLNNNDLRAVMTGILKGLRDIRVAASRPHGSLKPNNILLANSADLAGAAVHLSDPAPESALTPASDKKDYTDLARILYELVNLRPYQGGTIPRTKDWDELGPNGEDWRTLCNKLIEIGSGGGSAEDRDFDKIIATVDTWRAKPRRSKIPLVAAGVLVLLIIGGLVAYKLTRPPKLDFNQANWEKLCLDYQSWFENFANMDDATKKKFSQAPYPTDVVKILNSAGRDLERYQPQAISRQLHSYLDLAAAPTDDAKKGYGPYYTKQGVELIDKVSDAMTPQHWQLLGSLDKTAAAYEARGWNKPAAGIRGLIASARPPAVPMGPGSIEDRIKDVKKVDVFANVESTIRASNAVNDIDKRWASIQDLIKTLPATEVPLLKAFPKFAEDFARSDAGTPPTGTLADVQALSTSFSQIEQVVTQLSTDLNRKDTPIDFAELAKDPAAQLPAGGKITVAMYTELPKVARDYILMKQDPRSSVAWSQSLDAIQKELIDPIKESNPQDPNLQDLLKRKAAVQEKVDAFTKMAPIEKNRTQIVSLVTVATEDLGKLKSDGEMWVAPYIIDPDKYIAQQRARLTTGPLSKATPVVFAQWQKAQNALLAKVAAAPQELKKYRVFQATDAKFAALQNAYVDFDNKFIPPAVPGLSDLAAGQPAWKTAIAARVATVYREQALTDLMTNPSLKWADDLPQVSDPAYQSYARERAAAFEKTRTDTLALMDDFSTLQDRLDHLDLLPGEPAKDAKSWRDLAAKWSGSKNPLLADTAIAAELKPISDRAAALLALDPVNDYKALKEDAQSPAAEVALTAWRKLGDIPISAKLDVLGDEQTAQSHLGELLAARAKAGILEAPHAAALNSEMAGQLPKRWHRYADILTSAPDIQKALDLRPKFNVTLSVQSDPNLVYDEQLYALGKDFAKNPKEADLKETAKKFIASVKGMPAAVSGDKGIQDLMARMEKPLAPGSGEISTAGAGPKLANWEQESPSPDVRLFYFPTKAAARQVLEFTRIQAGNKTVFLCTTELSFGLFAQLANEHFADLDNTGKPAAQAHWFKAADDPWDGPRVWKIANGSFTLNPDWLFLPPTMAGIKAYPNAAPEKPGVADPMQQLSPWSAMYIARLLGCRLPTSEEWNAAYTKFEGAGAQPKDAWNLRGAGFSAQLDYAKQKSASGMPFPDTGIFLQADQLFSGITATDAKLWHGNELAKINPNRVSAGAGVYPTSQIWFRHVGQQPGAKPPGQAAGIPHDLVGNVAEYVCDAPTANAVIKDAKPSVESVNAAMAAESKSFFVIGGSSLSPPETPFNQKQAVDLDFAQTLTGFSDVGVRLAYTAPIDSIADVLAAVFKDPPYLPGAKAK